MRTKIRQGDLVKLSRHSSIPVRYQGRTATVTDTFANGNRNRALVDFPGRRVFPLEVSLKQLTLAA